MAEEPKPEKKKGMEMAENDKASRMTKLKAILNADAAIITILLAVGAGVVKITNQIAVLQSTSDNHTSQIDTLKTGQETEAARLTWLMSQVNQMRYEINTPNSPHPPAPVIGWPDQRDYPQAKKADPLIPVPHSELTPPSLSIVTLHVPPPQYAGKDW